MTASRAPSCAPEMEELMNENTDGSDRAGPAGSAADGAEPSPATSGQASPDRPSQGAPMNGADFQIYIGRGLRAVFDDVAKQPVPDRFLELMKKLG